MASACRIHRSDSQERIRVLYIFRKIFYNEKADRVVLTSLREVKKWAIA